MSDLTESAWVKTLLVSKKPYYFLAAVLRSPIIKVNTTRNGSGMEAP
jgi:hypothetical protein